MLRATLRQGDMGNHLLHLDACFCAIPDQVPLRGSSTRNMRCLSPRHAWTFTRSPYQRRVGATDWSSGPVFLGCGPCRPVCCANARPEGGTAKSKTAARSQCVGTSPVLGAGKAHEFLASRARLSQCRHTLTTAILYSSGIRLGLSDQRLTVCLPLLVYAQPKWENEK